MMIKFTSRALSTRAFYSTVFRPKAALASQACQFTARSNNTSKTMPTMPGDTCDSYYGYLKQVMAPPRATNFQSRQARTFSTAAPAVETNDGRAFANLDSTVLQKIKKDFQIVDENHDGLLQPEEFRKLLQMHKDTFSEHEINTIAESFYSGTSGAAVSFDRFLEALDMAAASKSPDKDAIAKKLGLGGCGAEYMLGSKPHAYSASELDIQLSHKEPDGFTNRLSFHAVKAVRFLFDLGTGWNGDITINKIMNRVIYLETIAAVPGMVAGILRHFKSLRAMERDGGMLNMFLEEALNERMHLLTFVKMKNPGLILRSAVLGGQVGFGAFYGLAYVISPKFCHSFVGYVEEEACSTYTKIIKAIETAPEGSELAAWRTELAPEIGKSYWHLGESGTVLDLMYAIRADEAEHRDVNHFASDAKKGDLAPVCDPKKQVDLALKKYVKDIMTV